MLNCAVYCGHQRTLTWPRISSCSEEILFSLRSVITGAARGALITSVMTTKPAVYLRQEQAAALAEVLALGSVTPRFCVSVLRLALATPLRTHMAASALTRCVHRWGGGTAEYCSIPRR